MSDCESTDLIRLCELTNQKWNLVYRATEHGFGFEDFYSKCSGKNRCLTIIKSENGNTFGGYTDYGWNKTNTWIKDENAYLFSLINKENSPMKMKCSQHDAIYDQSTPWMQVYGFNNGNGVDLALYSNSNVNSQSFSNLGNSYKHPVYTLGSTQAKEFMAGTFNFKTLEIEMYCKV